VKQSSSFSRQYWIYLSTVQICVHQTVWLTTQFVDHKLCSQPDWLFGSIVRFQTSNVAMETPTHLFCSVAADSVYSTSPSIVIVLFVRSFIKTALLMPQITPHNQRLQVAYTPQYRHVAGEWRREHDMIFIRSNPAFDCFQTSKANWLMIKR